MTATVDEQALIAALRAAVPGLRALYLFGSAAAGELRDDSDVDVAVLADPPLEARRCLELAADLGVALQRDVDLVDLRTASTVLRAQVMETGRRLFYAEGHEEHVEAFETFVYSDYARLNEERAGILQDVLARGRVHGR